MKQLDKFYQLNKFILTECLSQSKLVKKLNHKLKSSLQSRFWGSLLTNIVCSSDQDTCLKATGPHH